MTDFIADLIGNDILATIIMSLVPMIELKGGIVFARGLGLGFFEALGLAFLGSSLVCVPIFFLLRPLLNLLKKIKWFNKFAIKVEGFFESKATETMEQRAKSQKKPRKDSFLKKLGVFIFVAIPLPLTGIWTGTAIAVFLNLKFKEAILPLLVGNLVAGVLISGLAQLCKTFWTIESLDYILYALFGIAVILFVITIIKLVKSKPKQEKTEE